MTPVHSLWILDVLDILLVAVLFYRLLILVKGTRSAQMYVGLLVIVLIGILAREFVVIAASCILPLSANPRTPMSLGTRHRAGLGLSEETDAVVIVVSEQTGKISVAWRGHMRQALDEGELRSELSRIFRLRPE